MYVCTLLGKCQKHITKILYSNNQIYALNKNNKDGTNAFPQGS
jgi:hypothetical protein